MSDDESRFDRRTVLAGLGTAATAGITGYGALGAFSGGAVAVGSQNLGSVTIESDSGDVQYVAVHGDSVIEWSGFDVPATHFDIEIELDVVQDGDSVSTDLPKTIHETNVVALSQGESWGSADDSLSGPGTSGTIESGIGLSEGSHDPTTDWHVVGTDPDGYGLPSDPVDASYLEVDGSDAPDEDYSEEFTLVMTSAYTWYSSGSGEPADEIYSEVFETEIGVTVVDLGTDAEASGGGGGATGEPATPTPAPE